MLQQDGDASAAISPLYWINRGAKEEIRATKSAGCCAERHYQVLTVNTGWLQCGILQHAPHHFQFTVNPVKWQQRNKCLLKQIGVGHLTLKLKSRCLLVYIENQLLVYERSSGPHFNVRLLGCTNSWSANHIALLMSVVRGQTGWRLQRTQNQLDWANWNLHTFY